jgi:hypothetical protein
VFSQTNQGMRRASGSTPLFPEDKSHFFVCGLFRKTKNGSKELKRFSARSMIRFKPCSWLVG